MQIVQAPDPVLSAKAQPIKKIDQPLLELIEAMKETLITASDPEGVGIAAPQVGKSLQLFIIKPDHEAPFSVFINPVVKLIYPQEKKTSKAKQKKNRTKLEGCLSLKDIWGTVERAPKVEATYMDETGVTQTKVFSGWPATIIQHEHDHLEGILFPRRVLEQQGRLYKSHKDEEDQDVFEPLEL